MNLNGPSWLAPGLFAVGLLAGATFAGGCGGRGSGAVGGPSVAGLAVTPADGSVAVPLDGAIRLDFSRRQDRSSAERVIHLVSLTPMAGDSLCTAMMDSCCGAGGMSGTAVCGMGGEGSGAGGHAEHHGGGSGGMMGGGSGGMMGGAGMAHEGMMSDPAMLAHLVEHHAVRGGFVWQDGDRRADFVPDGGLEPAMNYMLIVGDAAAGSGTGSPALYRFRTAGGGASTEMGIK